MTTLIKKNEQLMFELVHPLDDAPEQKHSPEGLGPMHMTASVRLSLLALRIYLIFMGLMVFYSILHQAGLFGQ